MLGYSIHPPFVGAVDGMHPLRLLEARSRDAASASLDRQSGHLAARRDGPRVSPDIDYIKVCRTSGRSGLASQPKSRSLPCP